MTGICVRWIGIATLALSGAGCASSGVPRGGLDLSAWRAADASVVTGLWHGVQSCRADHRQERHVIVGIRPAKRGRSEVLAVQLQRDRDGLRYRRLTGAATQSAEGALTLRRRHRDRTALTFVHLEGLDAAGRLQALVMTHEPRDLDRYVKRCRLNALERVVEGAEGPLIESGRLLPAAEVHRRRTLIGDRDDLVGTWVGLGVCGRKAVPLRLELELDRQRGWTAGFSFDGRAERYRMFPSPGVADEHAHRFEPADGEPRGRLTRLSGRTLVEKDGRVAWLDVTYSGCKDALLYRHWTIDGLGGLYASLGELDELCRVVRDEWTGPVGQRFAEANAALRRLPPSLQHYSPRDVSRQLIEDAGRFRRVFGLDADEISPDAFELLTYQLASCAVLAPESVRQDIREGLFRAGTTRRFAPERRRYPLYRTRQELATALRHSDRSERPQAVVDEFLAMTELDRFDADADRLVAALERMPPASVTAIGAQLGEHRETLLARAAEAERDRIRREGPPRIDRSVLHTAVHEALRRASRTSDRALGPLLGTPPGFAYSCGSDDYCTALGGIVKYRYYVSTVLGCDRSSDRAALCRFRMGLDVQSGLSSPGDFRNRLLRGAGATALASVMRATLRFEDLSWRIVGGVSAE